MFNKDRFMGLYKCYSVFRKKKKLKGENRMKGYTVESGYMGYVNGSYMLFASEMDYEEYMEMDNR